MNARSEKALQGVHPLLVCIMREADKRANFIITEGLRTVARQRQLVAAGASRTMNSKHLTGHAVDVAALVNGQVRWDWPLYTKLAEVILAVAKEQNVVVTWGGNWRSFRDGPHYEIDPNKYPMPKEK